MLKADNSLVVMVDFQDSLIKAVSAQEESENAKKMLKAAKILNIPVIISEQYPKGLGNTNSKIIDLAPCNTNIIEKTSFSLLLENNNVNLIKKYNRKQIIIFGIETHICVLQTSIDLVKEGYEVYLIKNASKSRKEFEHNSGIDYMRDAGVKIITLEIGLFELLESSSNQYFKEVQALIK